MKKNIKTSEKSPFGVMLKFKLQEEFIQEQENNSEETKVLEEEFPLLYTVRYEETGEDGARQTSSTNYRGQENSTFQEAESRWMFDFSFSNVELLSITRQKARTPAQAKI